LRLRAGVHLGGGTRKVRRSAIRFPLSMADRLARSFSISEPHRCGLRLGFVSRSELVPFLRARSSVFGSARPCLLRRTDCQESTKRYWGLYRVSGPLVSAVSWLGFSSFRSPAVAGGCLSGLLSGRQRRN